MSESERRIRKLSDKNKEMIFLGQLETWINLAQIFSRSSRHFKK
jgi:hypothetical protein